MHNLLIDQDLAEICQVKPLILNLTNYVVMNFTANALLALGASPIMAHAEPELPDLIQLCQAINLNIGTLDDNWLTSIHTTAKIANDYHVPLVFDPVGVGASEYRTQNALKLLDSYRINIVRGNASEICALAGINLHQVKGVDATIATEHAITAAQTLSQCYKSCIVISGKTDYCVNDQQVLAINGGSSMMEKVTGMGCVSTSLVAAFASIQKDSLLAAMHAMTCMKKAGEIASQHAKGPGSFSMAFLDALFSLTQGPLS